MPLRTFTLMFHDSEMMFIELPGDKWEMWCGERIATGSLNELANAARNFAQVLYDRMWYETHGSLPVHPYVVLPR